MESNFHSEESKIVGDVSQMQINEDKCKIKKMDVVIPVVDKVSSEKVSKKMPRVKRKTAKSCKGNMESKISTEEFNIIDDVAQLQIDDDECETKKIRLDDDENTAISIVENVSSKKVSKKMQRVKQSTEKSRKGRKITNPLKCRSCAKTFTDTSSRRKHENNRVCSASKARDNLTICIKSHYESIYTHFEEAYTDIGKHMVKALGRKTYGQNKKYLLDESLRLMKRIWISEQFNIFACLEVIEKTETAQ